MPGRVFVVLAIDTEGPVRAPDRSDLLATWDDVDRFVDRLFEPAFRHEVRDSDGLGLVVSWFVLSWTGFRTNPVGREFGYHGIYDHYLARWGDRMKSWGDGVYWHYHQPAPSGIATEWTADWSTSREHLEILSRSVIDRAYFPSVFRAGGAIERNELSSWLEEWIPIDYSSRAIAIDWDAPDAYGGRLRDLSDWSRAPADWRIYHPSADDYQTPGEMRRVIVRCPDLSTGLYALSDDDVEAAFERAERGLDTVLATFDHDYRERSTLFADALMRRVGRAAVRHPRVRWRYANALKAAQQTLGWESGTGPTFVLDTDWTAAAWSIVADSPVFGPRPYVACRYDDTGEYAYEQAGRLGDRRWALRMGDPSRPRRLGIAGSDGFGNVGVVRYAWDGVRLKPIHVTGEPRVGGDGATIGNQVVASATIGDADGLRAGSGSGL